MAVSCTVSFESESFGKTEVRSESLAVALHGAAEEIEQMGDIGVTIHAYPDTAAQPRQWVIQVFYSP